VISRLRSPKRSASASRSRGSTVHARIAGPHGRRAALVADGVVELRGSRADQDVRRRSGQIGEVHPRLSDRKIRIAVDAADQVVGLALGRDRVRLHRGQPITVGEDQVLVGPGPGGVRKLADGQRSARQHQLALLAPNRVAIDVNVVERVVLAQGLLLVEREQQRTVVP
jgi:hypothetical protein